MIGFFRNGSPLRLLFLLLLLLLIRLPVLTLGLPLLEPELNWMLVGERMRQGHFLYTGIWDSIGPLSAAVYWLIDWQFGRSQSTYQVVALLLTFLQVTLFNRLTIKNQLYPENTYLPGLFYVVLMNLCFDFHTLSPVLMATTFLLLALDKLFIQLNQRAVSDRVFEAGFYLAVAALFHLPTGVFSLFALVSLLFFGSSDFRQYFLLIFGFSLPLALTGLIFYLMGNYEGFVRQFVLSLFTVDHQYAVGWQAILLLFTLPVVFVFLGVSNVTGSMRYINYQKRCQQIMVVYLIFAGIFLILTPQLSPAQLIVAVPGVAFFATPYFLATEKRWLNEVVFGVFFVSSLFLHYAGLFPSLPTHSLLGLEALRVKPTTLRQPVAGKRVLVLGEGLAEYRLNTVATPYLNWQLAKKELLDLDDYQSLINIYRNFEGDLPDVIIDRQRMAKRLFARIPALAQRYRPGDEPGVYWRRQ
ncbi:MAG: hypothetical protein H7Z75_12515 [Ferruginibacter sp.]|nr:hypothetical protein [Cytophagales bacterium]